MHPDELIRVGESETGMVAHLYREPIESLLTMRRQVGVDEEALDCVVRILHEEIDCRVREGEGNAIFLRDPDLEFLEKAYVILSTRIGMNVVDFGFRGWKSFDRLNEELARDCTYWQECQEVQIRHWSGIFNPIATELRTRIRRSWIQELVIPASPHTGTGWVDVDHEITILRQRFASAITPQDCAIVGHQCVRVLEVLSVAAYEHEIHGDPLQPAPPVKRTKVRLGAVLASHSAMNVNKTLDRFARNCVELAEEVKHSNTPTRTEAGVAADAVIILANLVRRLSRDEVKGPYAMAQQ
jgi:hypothetical protein